MENQTLVDAHMFCECHQIEIRFIEELNDSGLLHLQTIEEKYYIDPEELPQAEKMTRLHTDLGINAEGLDVIHHLLGKIEEMQKEIYFLRNRIDRFE